MTLPSHLCGVWAQSARTKQLKAVLKGEHDWSDDATLPSVSGNDEIDRLVKAQRYLA